MSAGGIVWKIHVSDQSIKYDYIFINMSMGKTWMSKHHVLVVRGERGQDSGAVVYLGQWAVMLQVSPVVRSEEEALVVQKGSLWAKRRASMKPWVLGALGIRCSSTCATILKSPGCCSKTLEGRWFFRCQSTDKSQGLLRQTGALEASSPGKGMPRPVCTHSSCSPCTFLGKVNRSADVEETWAQSPPWAGERDMPCGGAEAQAYAVCQEIVLPTSRCPPIPVPGPSRDPSHTELQRWSRADISRNKDVCPKSQWEGSQVRKPTNEFWLCISRSLSCQ